MRLLFTALACLISVSTMYAQVRYINEIFDDVTVTPNVVYGDNITVYTSLLGLTSMPSSMAGMPQVMDIYSPSGDTETSRPVIIYMHTGNFLPPFLNGSALGTKTDNCAVEICSRFARMGYVVASIDYRLGWNPFAATQTERTYQFVNALYRGVQDARTAVRYFRMNAAELGNEYGIDPSKIGYFGEGTGGYVSYAASTISDYNDINFDDSGMPIAKFWYDPGDGSYIPMVIEAINGDPEAKYDGFAPDGTQLCVGHYPDYSSDVQFQMNLGGALGDLNWLDQGDVPMVSFQCPHDPFAPYTTGVLIVPTTNELVVEISGAFDVHTEINDYPSNNNAVYQSANLTDELSLEALNNGGFDGMYPVLNDYVDGVPTEPFDSSPWQWWDQEAAQAYDAANGTAVWATQMTLNPTMSEEEAMGWINVIQGYTAPRLALAFEVASIGPGCTDESACNFNALATSDDGSCTYPSGCTDPVAINYDEEAIIDDESCCYDCGTIEGFVFEDLDYDTQYDILIEAPLGNQILQLENDGELSYLTTQPNGLYSFVVDTGMQTLSYYPPPNWQVNSNITEYDIDISVNNTIENLDFGISPVQTKSDLAIDLTTSTHVCSMTSNLWLNIKNDGTETVNGVNVELWVNSASTVQSASSNGGVSGNYVSWTIDGDFFPYVYSNQDTTLLVEIMTPDFNAMGSILVDSARVSTVQPNLLELQYSNNFSRADGEVMCSYDPNDKQVLPLECFNEPLDTLEYTIRFQNTGNYPATTVTLVDTLDLEKLDIMSLEILGGSHDYEWALRSPSVLEVVFNNINLVDSSVSFSESQGFIKYGIRVREELPDDSPTATPAYIFFDNNPPVITNEPEVRFFSNLSVSVEANDVSCFGEDDGEAMLNISSGESPYHIQWSNGEEEESISNLPPGQYSVEIIDAYTCTSTLDFEIDEFFCPAQYDGNGDGCVNVHDILDFLLEYGKCTPEYQIVYDGNLDGCSNAEDLINMLSVYGQCE